MPSKKFTFSREDLLKIGKVVGWTMASALVTLLIDLVTQVDFGTYVWAVPVVNSALYAAKRFISGRMDLSPLDTTIEKS